MKADCSDMLMAYKRAAKTDHSMESCWENSTAVSTDILKECMTVDLTEMSLEHQKAAYLDYSKANKKDIPTVLLMADKTVQSKVN